MVRNLLVLAVASLVGLMFVEGFLRAFPSLLGEEAALRMHWNEVRNEVDTSGEAIVVDDPEFGFRYLPHRTGQIARGDFSFTYTTDGEGFRNPWPWPAHADIVVVGDSMAFGYGVSDDATWTHLLDEALTSVDIVNLGVIGTGPPQYLEVLRQHGLELRPELVLFVVFPGNDLFNTDSFERWKQAGTETGYRRWRATGGTDNGQPGLLRRIWQGSYLVAMLRDIRRRMGSQFQGETLTLDEGGQLVLAPNVYTHAVREATPGNPSFERTMAIIEEARDLSDTRAAEFIVLLVPTKEEAYLAPLGRPYPALVKAFAEALDARGISYLDLSPALQARASAGEQVYFPMDGHPNENGYAVIAETVLAFLRDHAYVKGPVNPPKLD